MTIKRFGGRDFELTAGQDVKEDRESIEFRIPGETLSYAMEVAQYGDWGSEEVVVLVHQELPWQCVTEAIEYAKQQFGLP